MNKEDKIKEFESKLTISSKDLECPNLFISKIFDSSLVKAEVIAFDDDIITVKILDIPDEIMQRYLDVGSSYELFQHKYWKGNLLIWEVKPEQMKRQSSQIILQWEKDFGWRWDIDS